MGGRKRSQGRGPLSRQCPQGPGKLWFLTPHPVEKLPAQEKKSQLRRGFLQVGATLPRDESSIPGRRGPNGRDPGLQSESPTL